MNKSIAELTKEMEDTDNPVTKSVIKDIICSRALDIEWELDSLEIRLSSLFKVNKMSAALRNLKTII